MNVRGANELRDYKRSKPKGKCIGIFGLHYKLTHKGRAQRNPIIYCGSSVAATSHIYRIPSSSLILASTFPSDTNATLSTLLICPLNVRRSLPVLTSKNIDHPRTAFNPPPIASRKHFPIRTKSNR